MCTWQDGRILWNRYERLYNLLISSVPEFEYSSSLLFMRPKQTLSHINQRIPSSKFIFISFNMFYNKFRQLYGPLEFLIKSTEMLVMASLKWLIQNLKNLRAKVFTESVIILITVKTSLRRTWGHLLTFWLIWKCKLHISCYVINCKMSPVFLRFETSSFWLHWFLQYLKASHLDKRRKR